MSVLTGLFGKRRPTRSQIRIITVLSYDTLIANLGADVKSYWKFQNTGTDEKGLQNATITGAPQLNVPTIVDLDSVADGQVTDGKCIAWTGTAAEYASCALNAAHKTANGTVALAFQRDTAAEKSTLIAVDSVIATGNFAVEVNTNGSITAFQRDSGTTPVRITGLSGVIELNKAYYILFEWGTGGMGLYVWDADGNLRDSVTNALAVGPTASTSEIRFGSYHSGFEAGSHHDGPYARVIWCNRKLTSVEKATIARSKTILHEEGTPPPVTTNLPASLAEISTRTGRSVTKTVAKDGSGGFTSLQAALNASAAGDVIAVKGVAGNYKYFETINLTGKQGTSTNPIQVWGWSPDGTQPEITTEVTPMPSWTLVDSGRGIYQATISAANGFAYGYLPESEGGWQLIKAQDSTNFNRASTDDLYFGPHMWASGTTVQIRTQTDRRQTVRLIPDGKLSQGLPVQKNPNNWSGWRISVTDGWAFTFNNCTNLHFNWLDWFAGRRGFHFQNGSNNCRVTNGRLWYNANGYRQSQDGGAGSNNCLIERMTFERRLPPWMARGDVKGAGGSTRIMDAFLEPEIMMRGSSGLEVGHCNFMYGWDIVEAANPPISDIHFHHNLVVGSFESMFTATHAYNVHIHHNIWLCFAGPGHGGGDGQPAGKGAQFYIHHNIIDCAHAMPALGRIDLNASPFTYRSERVRGAHDTPSNPFPYRYWNNTFIGQDDVHSVNFNIGYLYGDAATRVPSEADRANEVWNCICVSPTNSTILGVSGFGDVVTQHPSVANGTPVSMMDGIIFARASGSTPFFRSLTKLVGGTVRTNYASLADYINQVGGDHYSASQHAKYPEAPQRWNGNSVQVDPQLNGGTLANSVTFTLDAQGRFQIPANWAIYRPHNTTANDQGVNIAGRWSSISAPDGPYDRKGIESSRTRFYIGAVDPVDDPNGLTLGPQP